MKNKVSQYSLSAGENSKDEPHSIQDNQCQSLVNMLPDNPSPIPRDGTDEYNSHAAGWNGVVRELIPWKDDIDGNKVIGIIDDDIKWMEAGAGAATVILAGAFTKTTTIVNSYRFQNSLFIVTDDVDNDENYIVEWDRDASAFTIRNTNIARQTQTFVIGTDSDFSFMEAKKWYGVAFTYSKRTDSNAVDGSGDPIETTIHHTGVNESPDDIDERLFEITNGTDNPWKSVAFGNDTFVAVSDGTADTGTGNRVMTSPDGITWTSRESAAEEFWTSVTFGNNIFVAVALTGTGNRVMTSPDGITWTSRTSAADNNWYAVTFGNSIFVAVAGTGTGNRVMTSPDGITWTIRVSAADNFWRGVTYDNSIFVAVAGTGTGNRVMTSPDGITWTIRVSAADIQWVAITYGEDLFVAVADSGTGNRVMTSPDGITWTIRVSAADLTWSSIAYGNAIYVTTSETGRVMTSPDGITWTSRVSAANIQWRDIIYSNNTFLAVAGFGTGNRVMTSPDGITWTSQVTNVIPDTLKVTLNAGLSMSDSQITHINFYRTNANDSQAEAEGDVFRFLKSIPVSGPNSVLTALPYDALITETDATQLGQTQTVDEMVGVSPMASASSITYYNGFMWLGGLNDDDDDRGRWFYSTDIGDIQNPLKYFSLFRYTDRFIETSQDDSEQNTGMELSQNDMCFIMSESVWFLRDGDPVTYGPQKISSTQGSKFPKSLVSINKQVHFLSNDGPATISGQKVDIITPFTVKEVWPNGFYNEGLFHTLGIAALSNPSDDKKDVISFYYKNIWFVGWKDTLVGLYMAPDKDSLGPFRVVFGDTDLVLSKIAVFSNDLAVFSSKPYNGYVPDTNKAFKFLSAGINQDDGSNFNVKVRSKAFYCSIDRRDLFGEAYDLMTYCNFTDAGALWVNAISDLGRYNKKFPYTQRATSAILQNQTINNAWRSSQQQVFPEGVVGNTFEIKINKVFATPYDFKYKGFDFSYILRRSYEREFVSLGDAETDSEE